MNKEIKAGDTAYVEIEDFIEKVTIQSVDEVYSTVICDKTKKSYRVLTSSLITPLPEDFLDYHRGCAGPSWIFIIIVVALVLYFML